MALRGTRRVIAVLAAFAMAGLSGGAGAQMVHAPSKPHVSPIKRFTPPLRLAGLWDKPNDRCMTKCQTHVEKGCYKRLSDKHPTADAMSLHEKCEDLFSLCLYDCMCDTCDENQIIIKKQKSPAQ